MLVTMRDAMVAGGALTMVAYGVMDSLNSWLPLIRCGCESPSLCNRH